MTTTAYERNVAAVREMLACISAGDPEGQLAHLDDAIVYEAPYYPEMPVIESKERMATMLGNLGARFAAVFYEVVDVHPTIDEDLVIAEVRGDHAVRDSTRRYQNHYVMFIRFKDGKVVHWREFSNPDVYRRAVEG